MPPVLRPICSLNQQPRACAVQQKTARQEKLQRALQLPSAAALSERSQWARGAADGGSDGQARGLEEEEEVARSPPLPLEAELQLQRTMMTEWPLYTAQLAAQVRLGSACFQYVLGLYTTYHGHAAPGDKCRGLMPSSDLIIARPHLSFQRYATPIAVSAAACCWQARKREGAQSRKYQS